MLSQTYPSNVIALQFVNEPTRYFVQATFVVLNLCRDQSLIEAFVDIRSFSTYDADWKTFQLTAGSDVEAEAADNRNHHDYHEHA